MLTVAGENAARFLRQMKKKILEGAGSLWCWLRIVDAQVQAAEVGVRTSCRRGAGRRRRLPARQGEQGEGEQTEIDQGEEGDAAQTAAGELITRRVVPVEMDIAEELTLLDDGTLQMPPRALIFAGHGQGLATRIADAETAERRMEKGKAEHLQADQVVPEQGGGDRCRQGGGAMLHFGTCLFLRDVGE